MAARYADRLAIVFDGGMAAADVPENVLTAHMLESVFGVRAVIGSDPVTGAVQISPVARTQRQAR